MSNVPIPSLQVMSVFLVQHVGRRSIVFVCFCIVFFVAAAAAAAVAVVLCRLVLRRARIPHEWYMVCMVVVDVIFIKLFPDRRNPFYTHVGDSGRPKTQYKIGF